MVDQNNSPIAVGMLVTKDVCDLQGNILVPAQTTLDENHVRILKMWGVHAISADGANSETHMHSEAEKIPLALLEEANMMVRRKFLHFDVNSEIGKRLLELSIDRYIQKKLKEHHEPT